MLKPNQESPLKMSSFRSQGSKMTNRGYPLPYTKFIVQKIRSSALISPLLAISKPCRELVLYSSRVGQGLPGGRLNDR